MHVNCPTCQRTIEWTADAEFRPFCSKKCQLIDLGDWATQAHSIPCDTSQIDSQSLDEEAIAEQYEQQAQTFFKE